MASRKQLPLALHTIVFLLTTSGLVIPRDGTASSQRIAPGPLVVNLSNQADGTPLGAVYVRLGGRQAASNASGAATFDGVPAGRHALVIEHPDFDRIERDMDLPPGPRRALDLALVPRVTTSVSGTVQADGHGGLIAGARMSLKVKETKASLKGDYLLATDWEGKFSVIDTPVGLYRVKLSAPGFADKEWDWQIELKEPDAAFTLSSTSSPAAMTVRVLESGSRKPLMNAQVTLAEASKRTPSSEIVPSL